jgi:DNA invertase Pin-like site-specific DNA recombinase
MSYQKIRELYESGQTIIEIASYFEVSQTCIYTRLKKSGATMRVRGYGAHPTKEAKQALRDKIVKLRAQNLTYKEIAETVGISHRSVRRYIKSSTLSC